MTRPVAHGKAVSTGAQIQKCTLEKPNLVSQGQNMNTGHRTAHTTLDVTQVVSKNRMRETSLLCLLTRGVSTHMSRSALGAPNCTFLISHSFHTRIN